MAQGAFRFDARPLPEPGVLEMALAPRLAATLLAPGLWPGHAMLLAHEEAPVRQAALDWMTARWPAGQKPDVLVTDDARLADESAAFVALSDAERGVRTVLVLAPVAADQLEIALPDLRSRLLGIASVSLPQPDQRTLEDLLGRYCAAMDFSVSQRDLEHAAALLPPRLGAVRAAVAELNETAGMAARVDRAALFAACHAVATQAGDDIT
jgi:hypothetical protein